jgi:hypothetical protein
MEYFDTSALPYFDVNFWFRTLVSRFRIDLRISSNLTNLRREDS